MNRLQTCILLASILLLPQPAGAAILGFEGFAPPGSLQNIGTATPYFEGGYKLAVTNDLSAVFDAASSNKMIGNTSDWFGFEESNTPSLTLTLASGRFNLNSLLLGPSTIGRGTATLTVIGHVFGGTTLTQSYANLTTATFATLNWSNLVSVDFRASDDAGLDNINVEPVPEPATALLVAVGVSCLLPWRRPATR